MIGFNAIWMNHAAERQSPVREIEATGKVIDTDFRRQLDHARESADRQCQAERSRRTDQENRSEKRAEKTDRGGSSRDRSPAGARDRNDTEPVETKDRSEQSRDNHPVDRSAEPATASDESAVLSQETGASREQGSDTDAATGMESTDQQASDQQDQAGETESGEQQPAGVHPEVIWLKQLSEQGKSVMKQSLSAMTTGQPAEAGNVSQVGDGQLILDSSGSDQQVPSLESAAEPVASDQVITGASSQAGASAVADQVVVKSAAEQQSTARRAAGQQQDVLRLHAGQGVMSSGVGADQASADEQNLSDNTGNDGGSNMQQALQQEVRHSESRIQAVMTQSTVPQSAVTTGQSMSVEMVGQHSSGVASGQSAGQAAGAGGQTANPTAQISVHSLDGPDAQLNAARLVRGLQNVVQQNGGSLTLRLTPPEMGTVRIQMQIQHASVNAQFHTETEVARSLIQQQLAQLRQSLENHGLVVERITVQPMQSSGSSQAHGQEQQDSQDGRSRGFTPHQHAGQHGGDRRHEGREQEGQSADFRQMFHNEVA